MVPSLVSTALARPAARRVRFIPRLQGEIGCGQALLVVDGMLGPSHDY
jgi:hypothetical protein